MQKNTAGQNLTVFAFDVTTNLPKTGDAANLTAYYDLDDAGVTILTDTGAAEASNAAGYYIFDLAQAETNGNKILFTAKSSTANVIVIAVPAVIYTVPDLFGTLDTIGSDASIAAGSSGAAADNTATIIHDIEEVVIPQTNLIGTNAADSPNAVAAQGSIATLAATIWAALTSGLTTAGSIGKAIVDFLTNAPFVFKGANAVTITVTDATPTALSAAIVRIAQGASTQLAQTNGSGVATFSLDDGDYTLTITKSDYVFAPVSVAVDAGHTAFTEVMTANSLPTPVDPSDCTVGFVARHNGAAMSGATFTFRCKTAPTGNGNGFVDEARTAIADTGGLVEIALPQTSVWTARGPFGGLFEIAVPAASSYLVPNFNV